jgi:hypothetical protein
LLSASADLELLAISLLHASICCLALRGWEQSLAAAVSSPQAAAAKATIKTQTALRTSIPIPSIARQRPHRDRVLVRPQPDPDLVSDLDRPRPLGPVAVDFHLAALHRFRRERTRLEEARRPQPLVQPDPSLFLVAHSLIVHAKVQELAHN